jgi:MSHA pilin protein MshA
MGILEYSQMPAQSTTQASGFTLIELVVVIAILGLLAAVALPRFANLQAEARMAKMNSVLGAIKSAATLAHATQLTQGLAANTAVVMEGVTVSMVNGYPRADSIDEAAGISSAEYGVIENGASVTFTPDAGHAACAVTYTQAVANNSPTYDNSGINTANCS